MTRWILGALVVAVAACDDNIAPPVIDGECREGCTVIADNLCGLTGIAVVNGQVYWNDCEGIITMQGTTTMKTSPSGSPQLVGLAVDGTTAYASNPTGGAVYALSTTTDAEVKVLSQVAGAAPTHLVFHAGFVYWTNEIDAGTVMRAPADGSAAATTIADTQAHPIGLAVDDANVYWADNGSGNVMKAPVGGGAATTIASGEHGPSGVAVDTEFVYWTNNGDGTIRKAPLAGGAAVTLASGQSQPRDIAVDTRSVYWARAGAVGRYALATGAVSDLATDQVAPAFLLAVGGRVYWSDPGTTQPDGRVVAIQAP